MHICNNNTTVHSRATFYIHTCGFVGRDIFTGKTQAMRQFSFGGPEVRDGFCLLRESSLEVHQGILQENDEEERGACR